MHPGEFQKQPSVIMFGRNSYIGANWKILESKIKIEIGSFVSIADFVTFNCRGDHNWKMVTTFPLRIKIERKGGEPDIYKGNIKINNDVWIGSNAIFMQGSKVGHGAIVGANTVVAGEVPPYAIVVGNPKRIIKYRFSERQIEKLLKICWWDWPDSIIKERVNDFYGDVDCFIEKYFKE